jgi:uncharacterized protein (TIGR00730 family)
MTIKRICVFCGSSFGSDAEYASATAALAQQLVVEGIGIVYGGARVGLMGLLADTALRLDGEIIGVMPELLVAKEIAHRGLKDLRTVGSMHERKAMMSDLSDAFIALPGGFGTMEEFCEVLTWNQLGIQHKPCGLLNVRGFYDPLLTMFDRAVDEGFLRLEYRNMVVSSDNPVQLIEHLRDSQVPQVSKWSSKDVI